MDFKKLKQKFEEEVVLVQTMEAYSSSHADVWKWIEYNILCRNNIQNDVLSEEKIEQLLKDISKQPLTFVANSDWIKVENKLPAFNKIVIGFGKDEDGTKVRDFCSVTKYGFIMQSKINKKVTITHWTDLPESPII